jgi:hypothetical protein
VKKRKFKELVLLLVTFFVCFDLQVKLLDIIWRGRR